MPIFVYGSVISDPKDIIYKPDQSEDVLEMDKFIEKIRVDNPKQLEAQLRKSFKGMMKAGAQKTSDTLIPKEHTFRRFKNFVNIQTSVTKEASENLNYYMTTFQREKNLLRYLRMSNNSDFLKKLYGKVIENIECDQVIFLPMIDNINLTN